VDEPNVQSQGSANAEWPEDWRNVPFEQRLHESLGDNRFSTLNAADLPIHAGQVATAVQRHPNEMFKQSLGFAIMGRNILLVEQLLKKAKAEKKDIADVYPFHLATTYLDGSRACCHILRLLERHGTFESCRPNNIGPAGYTVLDNMMIAILRNHSSVLPETIDENLRGAKRFGGEEVDICGRWDADSDCYLALLNNGSSTIPQSWKHKFCHTSIQTICHAIRALRFDLYRSPPSGIFVRRCFICGLKLQLQPLHTIVLTAFHLAQSGAQDEDLFGMICCILAFTVFSRSDAYDVEKCHVSIDLLLGSHSNPLCTHEELSAAEFADRLTSVAQDCLPANAKFGWTAICLILQQFEDQYTWANTGVPPVGYEDEHESLESDKDGEIHESIFWVNHQPGFAPCEHIDEYDKMAAYGRNRLLGHIWAACQCELLTYRRLSEGERWTSNRLDVGILLSSLESRSEAGIPFVAENLMKGYCACGLFGYPDICRRDAACTKYYSNLDIWDRTVFLDDTIFLDD
jgi:hypothetical protein